MKMEKEKEKQERVRRKEGVPIPVKLTGEGVGEGEGEGVKVGEGEREDVGDATTGGGGVGHMLPGMRLHWRQETVELSEVPQKHSSEPSAISITQR